MLTLPLISSLKGYRPEWLRNDIPAGLAIAAVGLPSAIAYPALAGLPPEVGLYASIMAVLGYALFGSSRQLITGPDAGTVMMLGAAFISLGVVATGDRIVARGRVIRAGRTVTVCWADVTAYAPDSERLVATMVATMMTVSDRGLSD